MWPYERIIGVCIWGGSGDNRKEKRVSEKNKGQMSSFEKHTRPDESHKRADQMVDPQY